jgi:hypothetical protein
VYPRHNPVSHRRSPLSSLDLESIPHPSMKSGVVSANLEVKLPPPDLLDPVSHAAGTELRFFRCVLLLRIRVSNVIDAQLPAVFFS